MIKKIFVLLLVISSSTINAQKSILPDLHRNSAVQYFVITAFGAKGDGKTLNTVFIQQAIDKAAAQGGGKVVVPAGRFVSGSVYLKTGVELYLEEGATLLGSTNRLDYGKEKAAALINGQHQQRISITGKGEIDGRGREVVKDLFRLLHEGVLQDEQWKTKRPTEINRPRIIAFINCHDIKVKGVTVKNGAGWVQDYMNCSNIIIDSITVNSTEYWNNDGIDIVNSKNVSITNCYVDAADDAICLKSEGGPGWCENVRVANCTLRSSANAFKLGTGSKGGFRNIVVRNLNIFDTYRSAIALEAVDGGFLENVDIQQVKAVNTGNAIFIRLGHRNTDSAWSTVKNIHIADVQVQVPAGKPDIGYPVEGPPRKYPHNVFPISITGLPGHDVENVHLQNITISYEGGGSKSKAYFGWDSLHQVPENAAGYPEFSMFGELPSWGLYVRHVQKLNLQNVQLNLQQSDYRPACIFDDVKSLRLDEINIPFCNTRPVMILNNVKKPVFNNLKMPGEEKDAIFNKAHAQNKYITRDGSEVKYTPQELALRLPAGLQPVLDYPMRDVSVCKGPDSMYYMTGTTGDPDMWAVTGDISIWKSKDLQNWEPVVTKPRKRSVVWNIDRNGSWEKKVTLRDGAPFRPLWAPEIQYFNNTFWLTYSIPRIGSGILKSISGKAEGPYKKVLARDAPLCSDIDASLFRDDDGKIYFVYGEGMIMPMKPDLSGPAGKAKLAVPANAPHVGFEGAFLYKKDGRYHMVCAEFVNDEYHCFSASADHIYGPYGNRRLTIPHGGHNTFFTDFSGNWWATFFGNDAKAPFRDRPALIRMYNAPGGGLTMDTPDTNGTALLNNLRSPVLFKGDAVTAFRDPAVLYHNGLFYLFFTLSETEKDQRVYTYVAMSTSADLQHWSTITKLTKKNQELDYSSPGNIVFYKGEWIMCLQTYPRAGYLASQMPRYGSDSSRLFVMRSKDLLHWSEPELLKVKGPEVSKAQMGRMIDPYLLNDKDEPAKWWCFFKQQGKIGMSYSYDLQQWSFERYIESGENPCVIVKNNQYVLFHSPENGIGIKRSADMVHWQDEPTIITLNQSNWPWAAGRITAGAVLDLTSDNRFKCYMLFFHGSGPLTEKQGDFDKNASIGIAWSTDLINWRWPGK